MNDKMVNEIVHITGQHNAVVLDSSMRLVQIVRWERALQLVISGNAYELIGNGVVRSPSVEMSRPLVICLDRYVKVRNRSNKIDSNVSLRTIRIRDDYTCLYCGKYGDTVDHIQPKSRGGGNTWYNLCVACKPCNARKADKTPKEAGMKVPVVPNIESWESLKSKELQAMIYEAISV